MNNGSKSYKGCCWSLIAAIVIGIIALLILPAKQPPEPSVVVKHDTLWRDSIIREPAPADSTPTGKIVYIKVPYPSGSCQGTGTWQDSATYQSPDSRDSIEIPLPIIQKRYDDSLYTAWVSGYHPTLDSILLHQPEIVTTITETIVKRAPRFSVGLSVGPGVSIDRERHMGVYVGFTATYRLWPK